jgi:hypothetical protein
MRSYTKLLVEIRLEQEALPNLEQLSVKIRSYRNVTLRDVLGNLLMKRLEGQLTIF